MRTFSYKYIYYIGEYICIYLCMYFVGIFTYVCMSMRIDIYVLSIALMDLALETFI